MSADTLAARIREIKEREAKATKGPWLTRTVKADVPSGKWYEAFHIVDKIKYDLFGVERVGGNQWRNDLDFAAHARADITYLLEQLEKALSELSAAEKAARKEEREQCCKDVCDYCRHDGPPVDCVNEDHSTPAGDDGYPRFMHRYADGTEHECDAASIRNRE